MSEQSGVTRREALRITAVSGVGLAFGGGLVWELVRRAGLHRVTETRGRLGTLVTITSVHPDGFRLPKVWMHRLHPMVCKAIWKGQGGLPKRLWGGL